MLGKHSATELEVQGPSPLQRTDVDGHADISSVTNGAVLLEVADSMMFTSPHPAPTGFWFAFSTFHYS